MKPVSVGILLIEGFAFMSYAATVEPLRAANLLSGKELYSVHHLTPDDRAASSSSGVHLPPDLPLDHFKSLDYLFVIAGGRPEAFEDDELFLTLRECASEPVILGGVSGGPYILAKSGVMSGRRMTIHWEHAQSISQNHQDLLLTRSLYVMDRDRLTCAGGTAPLDMMHAIISGHHGPAFAQKISDWFMHTEVRPASGRQRSGLVERYGTTHPVVIDTLELMENHLADPLSLEQLSMLNNVSTRQLNRVFKSHLNTGTMAFYRGMRLELAHKLCLQTTLGLAEIAEATGFSSPAHFSKAFGDYFNLPPSELRANMAAAAS